MRSLRGHSSLIQDKDAVRMHQCADSVGDQDHRAAGRPLFQRLPDLRVRLGVDGGQRVIKDHDLRLPDQHLRNRRALLLSAGECHPPLADVRVVSFREMLNRVVQTRGPRRPAHLVQHHTLLCDGDVL